MKKALKLIFMYIILIAAGLLIGTLFYSLFLDVLNFAAGRKMIILNLVELKKAFFVVASFMMILICPLLIYTRIRHKGGVLQLIAFETASLLHDNIDSPRDLIKCVAAE